jgi:Fe-S cluster assembly protein SufD
MTIISVDNTALRADVERLAAREPAAVAAARREALACYEALPFPTESSVGWRRTDLAGLDLTPPPSRPSVCRILRPSGADRIQTGVLEDHPEVFTRPALATAHTGLSLHKFSALAQALWQGGGFVHVPPGMTVADPIHVEWEAGPYPRLVIVIGAGAEATIFERHAAADPYVAGKVDLVLEEGARLHYAVLQDRPRESVVFLHQRAEVGRDAKLVTLNFAVGGKLARADVEVELLGPGAESDMLGLIFGEDRQQFDYHTLQGHRAPHTRSDLLFKAALDDRSHAAYTGVIIIDRGAQRSDAYQANRNLLLSEGARADTEPMLEIEADDVRCTHGATVGPVDEEQLFYVMSRGLAPDPAARVIVDGFFEEVLEKFDRPSIAEALRAKVDPHLSRVGAH